MSERARSDGAPMTPCDTVRLRLALDPTYRALVEEIALTHPAIARMMLPVDPLAPDPDRPLARVYPFVPRARPSLPPAGPAEILPFRRPPGR